MLNTSWGREYLKSELWRVEQSNRSVVNTGEEFEVFEHDEKDSDQSESAKYIQSQERIEEDTNQTEGSEKEIRQHEMKPTEDEEFERRMKVYREESRNWEEMIMKERYNMEKELSKMERSDRSDKNPKIFKREDKMAKHTKDTERIYRNTDRLQEMKSEMINKLTQQKKLITMSTFKSQSIERDPEVRPFKLLSFRNFRNEFFKTLIAYGKNEFKKTISALEKPEVDEYDRILVKFLKVESDILSYQKQHTRDILGDKDVRVWEPLCGVYEDEKLNKLLDTFINLETIRVESKEMNHDINSTTVIYEFFESKPNGNLKRDGCKIIDGIIISKFKKATGES